MEDYPLPLSLFSFFFFFGFFALPRMSLPMYESEIERVPNTLTF
jgi:hypothetical protein